jgi:prevent-host-death family protein
VGMRDLGQNVSRVLARVKKGESLVVTDHGRPVARLVPYTPTRTLDEMVASGEVTPPSGDLQEFLKRFAEEPPVISPVPLSHILQEMRDDERW